MLTLLPGARAEARFTIGADHPSLPGHFPGAPVVPGVVILDEVLAGLQLPAGEPVALPSVKFVRPLLPGQIAIIEYKGEAAQIRFSVSHDGELLASGLVRRAGPVAPR